MSFPMPLYHKLLVSYNLDDTLIETPYYKFSAESYRHANGQDTVFTLTVLWLGSMRAAGDFGEHMGVLRCEKPGGWREYKTHLYVVEQGGEYLIDGFRTMTYLPDEETYDPYEMGNG
jgi:hypothetical protein